MKDMLESFFKTVTTQLKLICEGQYEATDEVLKFSDTKQNEPEVAELAETVGLMSVKLEAREMALEQTIDELKQNLSERKQFSIFFIMFTLFISIFTFVSAYLNQAASLTSAQLDIISPLVSLGFLALLLVLALVQIRLSPFSIKDFGLTFCGSRKAIAESLLATAVVLGIMTLLKMWCRGHLTVFEGQSFFNTTTLNYAFWTYLFVAPLQEFIARGLVQTTLYRLMTGKHRALSAVILASLIFAVTHTYFSFWISMASILMGFLWGWLYHRHQTIVGVAISHFLIGNYAELMNFWALMK